MNSDDFKVLAEQLKDSGELTPQRLGTAAQWDYAFLARFASRCESLANDYPYYASILSATRQAMVQALDM